MSSLSYQAKYQIVSHALRELDPFGLLAEGAPNDEFDNEAHQITRMIDCQSTAAEIAHAFAQVINTAFGLSNDDDAYMPIAEYIHATLHSNIER